MNFYNLNQEYPKQIPIPEPINISPENFFYKINELENRLKKLELRIQKLELSLNNNFNNNEPDNQLYMI